MQLEFLWLLWTVMSAISILLKGFFHQNNLQSVDSLTLVVIRVALDVKKNNTALLLSTQSQLFYIQASSGSAQAGHTEIDTLMMQHPTSSDAQGAKINHRTTAWLHLKQETCTDVRFNTLRFLQFLLDVCLIHEFTVFSPLVALTPLTVLINKRRGKPVCCLVTNHSA